MAKKWINFEEMQEQHRKKHNKKFYGRNKNSKRRDEKNYFLPNDSNNIVKKVDKIENLGLLLNKAIIQNYNTKKARYEFKVEKIFSPKFFEFSNYYNYLSKLPIKKKDFELKTNWKLSIGLGGTSVYETSITLHHIYGVPYIPGSAIKGSFRSYLIEQYFSKELEKYNNYGKFEQEILFRTPWFIDIFGTQDKQGKVLFFDAFSEDTEIKKDIMNPHYPDYYDNKGYPTDDQNPKPINFLTVSGSFKFVIGVKENIKIKIKDEEVNILEFVEKTLKESLQNFGIGAKTSVGYGYFINTLN